MVAGRQAGDEVGGRGGRREKDLRAMIAAIRAQDRHGPANGMAVGEVTATVVIAGGKRSSPANVGSAVRRCGGATW